VRALLATAVAALALHAAVSFAAEAPAEAPPADPLLVAPGSGGPMLVARGLVPGASRSGSMTVGNAGPRPVALRLRAAVRDEPGPGGGALSQALVLKVADDRGRTVYSGPPASLRAVPAGRLAAGERRRYAFELVMPQDTPDAVQGAGMSASFDWSVKS
jgi:hypothetical protein